MSDESSQVEQTPKLDAYRQNLYDVQVKLSESYDKLIITLSGGALALSITFLKDIIKVDNIVSSWLLLSAWGLFVVSLTCILGEILFGIKAFKKAIKQIDDGTIYGERVGGKSSAVTNVLQISASVTLIIGLVLISVFVYFNMGECHDDSKTKINAETTITTPKAKVESTPKAKVNSNPATDSTKTGLAR